MPSFHRMRWIFLATGTVYSLPAEARFLQVDPIGYEDQINLYTYVNNDPINNRDPSGLKCTGDVGNMTCVFDSVNLRDGPKLTSAEGAAAKAFERRYTAAVNSLSVSDKTAIVSVKDQPSFKVSAKEIGASLARSKLTFDPRGSSGRALAVSGGSIAQPQISIFSGALAQSAKLQSTIVVHEGIHRTVPAVLATPPANLGREPGRTDHQIPYNRAADELLEPQ